MFIEMLNNEERGKLFDKIASILECKNKHFGYDAKWRYDEEKSQCFVRLDIGEHQKCFWFRIKDFEFSSEELFRDVSELKKAQKYYFSFMAKRFPAYVRYLNSHKSKAKMSYNQSMSL